MSSSDLSGVKVAVVALLGVDSCGGNDGEVSMNILVPAMGR